jgi:hypothetical protein
MEMRGEQLRIYMLQTIKVFFSQFHLLWSKHTIWIDPNCAEILYELSKKERKSGDLSWVSSLLATSLDLEQAQ